MKRRPVGEMTEGDEVRIEELRLENRILVLGLFSFSLHLLVWFVPLVSLPHPLLSGLSPVLYVPVGDRALRATKGMVRK